jgi:hypothetical protein
VAVQAHISEGGGQPAVPHELPGGVGGGAAGGEGSRHVRRFTEVVSVVQGVPL